MGLIELFGHIIEYFLYLVMNLYQLLLNEFAYLENITFNIYLFSDTGWFNEPIPLFLLFVLIMSTFMFIFLIRLLWKGTKKFINMIFGVFRV